MGARISRVHGENGANEINKSQHRGKSGTEEKKKEREASGKLRRALDKEKDAVR